MKKFLTVLLALSVVFTYTVGTAFAGYQTGTYNGVDTAKTDYTYVQAVDLINAQVGDLKEQVATYEKTALTEASKGNINPIDSYKISYNAVKAVYDKMADDEREAIEGKISGALKTLNADNKDGKFKGSDIKTILETITTVVESADWFKNNAKQLDLLAAELDVRRADAVTEIGKVDLTKYSKDVPDDGVYKSNYDLAKDAVDTATKAVEAQVYDKNADTVNGKIEVKIEAVKKAINDLKTTIGGIPTITDETYVAEDLATAKSIAIAQMTATYENAKATYISEQNDIIRQNQRVNPQTEATKKAIADAQEKIATAQEQYTAAIAIMKAQIEGIEKITDKIYNLKGDYHFAIGSISSDYVFTLDSSLQSAPAPEGLELAVKKAEKIEDLKAEAELAKQFIGIEGSQFYDEASVDKALDDAVADVYAATKDTNFDDIHVSALTPAAVLNARIAALIGSDNELSVGIEKKAYPTVYAWAKAVADEKYNYNDDVEDAIVELAENTADALVEAKTVAEAEKIFLDAYAEFDAYMTSEEFAKLYAKDGELYADTVAYEAQIRAAVAAKHELVDASGDYNFDKTSKFADKLIAKMRTATTKAELDQKFAEAKTVVDGLKTVDALKAEMKALNEKALAIKTPVAVEQEAELTALLDAYAEFADYVETIDCNETFAPYTDLVKGYLQTVANEEAKAINEAVKALGKVTVADKEAVEKIVADKKALDKLVADYKLTATTPAVDLKNIVEDLSDAQVAEVKTMIKLLDPTVTADNIAKVREAQAAYDALRAGQKVEVGRDLYDKLVAVVKLADKYEINAVKTLKVVKNHSVAGKGYIKLAWSTVGDAKAADGYQVFRSKKMNSGYGTKPIFTTKSANAKTYKNTTVKKGTKYYYKVRAFVEIDGQKYYSDWSNKAYRVAK